MLNIVSLERMSEDFLEDLAEFLGKPLADVKTEANTFDTPALIAEWKKYGLDIYTKSERYLYDLWRNINEATLTWIQPLLLLHEKKILDFGGGAATISLLLCKNGNEVTYYDLPGIIFDFAEFRAKKRGINLKFVKKLDMAEEFDLVIANEVFEHVTDLDLEISRVAQVLTDYGTLYFKNGFGSFDIYPMHFDYANIWKPTLLKYNLNPTQAHIAIKNGYQTKIRALKATSNCGTGWHGILNPKSEDPLVATESKLLREDYDLLLECYVDLIKETKWSVILATPTHDSTVSWGQIPALTNMVKPPHAFFNTVSPLVCYSRNQIVEDSLISGGDWTHLWFLDSDVIPPAPYGLMRLLQRDKDLITGLYAKKTIPNQWLIWINQQPVQISDPSTPFDIYPKYRDKVIEVTGAGAGCLLVKREVFEKVSPPWFKVDYREGSTDAWGEDVYFFNKARAAGFKFYMDTSVMCLHMLNKISFPVAAQAS